VQERSFTDADARFWVACLLAIKMLAALGGGLLSDFLGARKKCILAPFAILVVLMLCYFQPGYGVVWIMLLVGGVSGLVVTPSIASAPDTVKNPGDIGMALAVLALGMNGGIFFGPAVYGMIVDSAGWQATVWFSVPTAILGFTAAWGLKIR
jgi:predicted MFS family arabinose efflux permease